MLSKPDCVTEHAKYASIGATILLTSIMASLSGAYVLYLGLRSITVSIIVGLFWGLFVFAIDRYQAATFRKDSEKDRGGSWKILRGVAITVPRLLIMIFIGVVIAFPLEMKLFEREIESELVHRRGQILEGLRKTIRDGFPEIDQLGAKNVQLQKEIDAKQSERDRLLGLAVDELTGKNRSGTTALGGSGSGPVYQQRQRAVTITDRELEQLRSVNGAAIAENNERLKALNALVAIRQDEAEKSVNASDGVLARLEALTQMADNRPVMKLLHYALIVLFVLLGSGPTLLLTLANPGPYDNLLSARERESHVTFRDSTAAAPVDPEGGDSADASPIRGTESAPTTVRKTRDPYRLVGTEFGGKYRLEEYAGGGGMGAVYRAIRKDSKEWVAVKILKPDLVVRNSRNAVSFQREVEAARSLDHKNIVRVLDAGVSDEISFMVMEWLDGDTLEDVMAHDQLSMSRVVDIFIQICDAFIVAHAKNIIHLDIKPANVFLLTSQCPTDRVKVIDFGMARVLSNEAGTTVTRFLGTYQYCSPEHFGGRVSYRSDIYSLGATLYHMIAGVIPFGTSYINAKMHPDLELPPVPSVLSQRPEVPGKVDSVIGKALSKRPHDRQQSVKELLQDFLGAMGKGDDDGRK